MSLREFAARFEEPGGGAGELFKLTLGRIRTRDPEAAELLRWCAIPRTVSAELIGVLRERPHEEPKNAALLGTIIDSPFINRGSRDSYVYDDDIRAYVIDEWRETLERRTLFVALNERLVRLYLRKHDDLYTFFQPNAMAVPPIAYERAAVGFLLEALYHACLISPETGYSLFDNWFRAYEINRQLSVCEALLQGAEGIMQPRSAGSKNEFGWFLEWLPYWQVRLLRGKLAFEEARSILIDLLGKESTPSHIKTTALGELGAVLVHLRDFKQAYICFEKVADAVTVPGAWASTLPAPADGLPWWYDRVPHVDRVAERTRLAIQSNVAESCVKSWLRCSQGSIRSYTNMRQEARDDLTEGLASSEGDSVAEAHLLLSSGETALRSYNYKDALKDLEKAHKLFEIQDGKVDLGRSLTLLGVTYYRMSRPVQARDYYNKALRIYSELGYLAAVAESQRLLGDCLLQTGELNSANDLYRRARQTYELLNHQLGIAHTLRAMAEYGKRIGELDNAAEDLSKSLEIYRDLGVRLGEANCLMSFSELRYLQTRYHDSLDFCAKALQIYRVDELLLGEANCLTVLGQIRTSLHDVERALEAFSKARQIYSTIGDGLGQANCYLGMAKLAQSSQEAEARVHSALDFYRRNGFEHNAALATHALGLLALKSSKRADAIRHFRDAITLFERIGSPDADSVQADLDALVHISATKDRARTDEIAAVEGWVNQYLN